MAEQGYSAWIDDARFVAMQASDRPTLDPEFFGPTPEGSTYQIPRALVALARDNRIDEARAMLDEFETEQGLDDLWRLLTAAFLGDRDTANAAASRIDGKPGGSLALAQIVYGCLCGAPFDLEATPRFRARVTEAGFAWPPAAPITYPAKDW